MRPGPSEIFRNILIGLAVSVVILNLGAAFGVLSGRGAFAGMMSAGIIALVASLFGGTRIQGSGSTAPMGALTAVVVAYAAEQIPEKIAGISADQFVNIVLFLTALLLIVFAVLRVGRFIAAVPQLVISGFMCGIALIIWMLQFNFLFGVGRAPVGGALELNLVIVAATLAIAFLIPPILKKFSPRLGIFLPGTLVAVVLVSAVCAWFDTPVAYLDVGDGFESWAAFKAHLSAQIPNHITAQVILMALPFAVKLALLCYVDTLLTSLIVDKMRGTCTLRDKELAAQGMATALVGLVGGVPGAQSTVPSVLTIKEGATLRLAGASAGVFVLLGMLLFADLMAYIPQAVFIGILIKVGFDVFDFRPFAVYTRTIRRQLAGKRVRILNHREMGFLSGTALLTVFVDLILAVGLFSVCFHFFNRIFGRRWLRDYVPG